MQKSFTYEEALRIACSLPETERILLADALRMSAEIEQPEIAIAQADAAWGAEVERRVAEIEAGTAETRPWEELESELRARLAR